MGRYLVAASPIPGHVEPMLLVGADLSARGHTVAMVCGGEHRRRVEEAGMRHIELQDDARPRRPGTSRVRSAPGLVRRWINGRAEMASVFIDPLTAQYEALRKLLSDNEFDAVLCDIAFTGAMPLLLGDEPRPAVIACGVGPLTLSSVDTAPFGMGWRPKPGRDHRAMTWVVHHALMGDIQAAMNRRLAALGSASCPVFLTDWPVLADRLVQFTIPAMEYPRRDLPASVSFAGPVVPAGAPRRRCDGTSNRFVVHVTQGTWNNQNLEDLILPALDGLAGRDDVTVIATTGRPIDAELRERVSRNAHLTDYVPYRELLPSVDVMVTNGGYGGVHQALMHGIPLIVAGATADKPEIAARVAHAGVGLDLGAGRHTASEIAAAVDHMRQTPHYRQAACRIGREMRRHNAFDHIAEVLSSLHRPAVSTL